LDNFSSGYRWLLPDDERITVVEGSVLDEEKLNRVFKHGPDYVYHLAAHFANQNSVDHPRTDLRTNGMGTLKILEYANLVNSERVVYASSGCGVYGHDSEPPFEEGDISTSLDTPYQVTKLLGELYTNYFYNLYDLPIANARFFNSFGPGEVPGRYRNVIPNFFYWSYQGHKLPITGDGSETRDWTYVGDIVDGLLRMGVKDAAIGESFNLATGNDTQVIDMAESILDRVDNSVGVEYVDRRDWDNKTRIVGSIEKAQRLLGYEPSVPFEEGIDRVHEWFETNYEQIDSCAEF
jgi:nucleoside-diphosphate-sugar epimerase